MITFPTDYLPRLLEGGAERRNLEFKPSFDWNDDRSLWLREKVIQAILGFSNTPLGGVLLLGIEGDSTGTPRPVGLTEAHRRSFDTEAFKSRIDGFASSATVFQHGVGDFEKVSLLVIQVSEFERRPIICKKNGSHQDRILCEGEVYVMPDSTSFA